MELNRGLQGLIERAWSLHDGITAEIENTTSFCRFCSENGRYCAIVETPFLEKERLIAIRDVLKEVRDVLMFLQKLQYWQPMDRQEALARLEKSRISLIEEVKRYKGRPLVVLKELNSSFNNGETAFDWDLVDGKIKNCKPKCNADNKKRRMSGLVICCIKMLFSPWKWQKAVVIGANLLIVSASIKSTVYLCHARHQYCSTTSQRKVLSFVESTDTRTTDTKPSIPNSPVHVFRGRG